MALSSPLTIELAPQERDALERLAASRTAPAGRVQRAQAILAATEGQPNAAIARWLGRHLDTVRRWRKRFTTERLAAVSDRPRPRGRPQLTPQERVQIIAAATSAPPPVPAQCGPISCWLSIWPWPA